MQRVAIYSRKSVFTGKGESIENQIELCKEYIEKNYVGEQIEYIVYEDEGFSGGNTNRPAFQKLLKDIKNKKINTLICYKLDRISRNVADFSNTLEYLESNRVNFISLKEQFDTTSAMGRAMVYISSVFAQLERETIAERVKDNMIQLAKMGRWTGGKIPLGFESEKIEKNKKIIPTLKHNIKEMEFVKFLYEKYLELGSLHKLEVYITQNELKSRNGIMFEKSTLKIILQNTVYVKANEEVVSYLKENDWNIYGEPNGINSLLSYNKTEQVIVNGKPRKQNKDINERFAAISNIKGYIEPELWLKVQRQFNKNRDKFPRLGKTHNVLLVGKITCGNCGSYMLVQHGRASKVTGEKLFYYNCSLKRKSKKKLCSNPNAKAGDIDEFVLEALKKLSREKREFIEKLKEKHSPKNIYKKDKIELDYLNKSIVDKKKQIDNLVNILSSTGEVQDIFLDKIKQLKIEIEDIKRKISLVEYNKEKKEIEKKNIELIDAMLNECEIIDTLSRERQKQIINILIDKVLWYGDGKGSGTVKINFIGTEEDYDEYKLEVEKKTLNRLQFCSHSTCKTNDHLLPYREIKKNQRIRKSKICRSILWRYRKFNKISSCIP